jgi:ribosome-associated heat shock protein Hsp15
MASAEREKPSPDAADVQRLDKWLWFSRILKSRTLAAQLVSNGKVRVNRTRAVKPSQTVRPGDVLTVALRGKVRVLRVLAAGDRRGPPAEAQGLYELVEGIGTKPSQAGGPVAERDPGAARPTKRDRRLTERLRERE